jgi:hypothetical protein
VLDLLPGASAEIRLLMDSSKESGGFTGDLLITVDALDGTNRVGSFDVSISIVAPEGPEEKTEQDSSGE